MAPVVGHSLPRPFLELKTHQFGSFLEQFDDPFQNTNRAASALCVFVNGELGLGFLELSLSFYGRPNISDRFTFHFIRIQIFQIDFPLILYL